jgi:hypothetical protein
MFSARTNDGTVKSARVVALGAVPSQGECHSP